MPSATPYDRQFSFALYSAENPTSPHSGVTLDAEFNAVKLALDETQQNLGLIQDDDGVLKRGSVGRAQFDASITLGFGAPAAWAAGATYNANISTVFYNSRFYAAVVDHTAGALFDASKWAMIADLTLAAIITDGSITSAKLADGAVAASKIADGSISNSKLASGAVSTSKIADLAVTVAKIADTALLANALIPAGLGPLPWSLPALPAGWDWADGGVLLSDTAFPALRAAYISASFPYGQDGSGNPKKPDMRGRVAAGKDNMGGTAAGRLTTASSGIDGLTLGAAGGTQNQSISQAQLPNAALTLTGSGAVSVNSGSVLVPQGAFGGISLATIQTTGNTNTYNSVPISVAGNAVLTSTGTISVAGATSSINGGVTQAGLIMVQPTLVCNSIIKAH